MNKLTLYTAGLIVMAVALPCTAKEFTLEEAMPVSYTHLTLPTIYPV